MCCNSCFDFTFVAARVCVGAGMLLPIVKTIASVKVNANAICIRQRLDPVFDRLQREWPGFFVQVVGPLFEGLLQDERV